MSCSTTLPMSFFNIGKEGKDHEVVIVKELMKNISSQFKQE